MARHAKAEAPKTSGSRTKKDDEECEVHPLAERGTWMELPDHLLAKPEPQVGAVREGAECGSAQRAVRLTVVYCIALSAISRVLHVRTAASPGVHLGQSARVWCVGPSAACSREIAIFIPFLADASATFC